MDFVYKTTKVQIIITLAHRDISLAQRGSFEKNCDKFFSSTYLDFFWLNII